MFHHSEATYGTSFISAVNYSGSIQYLEHVNVTITVLVASRSGRRGDIGIELTSPSGTVSTLLGYRYYDDYNDYFDYNDYYDSYYDDYYYYDTIDDDGYLGWPFMSVMFWGEDPTGEWTLNITTRTSNTKCQCSRYHISIFWCF